jgi:limonene-1,2-epoxide hydrolase
MDRRNFMLTCASASIATVPPVVHAARVDPHADGGSYINVVTGLIADWRRKDIDALLSRVTPDIVWYSHVGSEPRRGTSQMRAYIEPMAAGISDIRWRIFNHAVSGNRIFLEGADDFVLVAEKRRVAIPYMGIMAFRGSLICEWRDYFDRGLFDRLKAGETPPLEIAELLNRPAIP